MKKILLTCFEPFGGETINPSAKAMKNVIPPFGCELIKLQLPVLWEGAEKLLFDAIDDFSPDSVLMTGQAGGTSAIRIERVAINLCGAIKDEAGLYPGGSARPTELPAREGAPAAYFSTYDARKILDALKKENIPAGYSYSAGTYICNYIMFSALDRLASTESDVPAGFIHLPYADGQKSGSPSMGIDMMSRAIEIILAQMI